MNDRNDEIEHVGEYADAYVGLAEADPDSRWAFGSSFDDPLAGLDVTVPPGVDARGLAELCVGLGDDALLLAQRLNLWCTHAPELEEEVALANIALDLIGQARMLYARAAAADPALVPELPAGSPVPAEDRLAYFRDVEDFRNIWLAELPDADFAHAVLRLSAFAAWRLRTMADLCAHADPVLAAVAAKAVKELRYHQEWSARWVEVLENGTTESARRLRQATEVLQAYVEQPDLGDGRRGKHTEHLAPLLADMQRLARAHPAGRW